MKDTNIHNNMKH